MNSFTQIIHKPKIIIPVVAALAVIVGALMYSHIGTPPVYTYAVVQTGDVSGDVRVSGTVAPADAVNLSFPKSGRVNTVSVQTGQSVYAGQVLAVLDSGDIIGSLNQAKGAYEAAQANYQKVVNGASGPDIDVAKAAVASAQSSLDGIKSQADTAVNNAYRLLLNSGLAAIPSGGDPANTIAPIISGTYTGPEGQYIISPYSGGNGQYFSISGLENGGGQSGVSAPQPVGTHGLFVQFPPNFVASPGKEWIVNIPNLQSPTYVTNYNAYQSALTSRDQAINNAQAALAQAQTNLAAKQAAARPEDVQVAKAQIDSTLGAYQAAQGAYANDLITAPIAGTITVVNIKAGQNATANQTAIGIISQGNFQVDTYVSGDDLATMRLGATSTVVFDAYPGVTFNAKIIAVDTGSAVTSSDAQYKVTFQLTDIDPRIQSGLTAHITVAGEHKSGVLVIPRYALVTQNGVHTVIVKRGSSVTTQVVQTGIIGSDTVEVISGLSAGDSVALLGDSTTY